MTRTLRILTLVAAMVLLAILLLEAALRLGASRLPGLSSILYLPQLSGRYADARTTAELLEQSAIGYRPGRAIGGVRIGESGLPAHGYETPPGADSTRIIVLGDSFCFNDYPWEWMWHQRLDAILDERLSERDGDVDLHSWGIPATSPDFYLRLWQLEGAETQADVVLVTLTVGNDITDDAISPLERAHTGFWLRKSLALRALRNGAIVLRHLVTTSATEQPSDDLGDRPREKAEARPGGLPVVGYADRFDDERPSLSVADYRDLMWKRTIITRKEERSDLDTWLRRLRPVLAETRDAIEARGALPVFVLMPDEYQIDPQLYESLLQENGYTSDDLTPGLPQRLLRRYFDRHGFHYVDLLDPLRERGATTTLYRPRDSHLNRVGNQVAAEVVADYLEHELRIFER